MTSSWIGIDPGQSGGLSHVSGQSAEAFPMPLHDKADQKTWGSPIDWWEVFQMLKGWKQDGTRAVVEQSQAMPGNGVSSMFKYGGSYVGLLAVLQALSIKYALVRPAQWKRKLLGQAEEGEGAKDRSISYCKTRWPDMSLRGSLRSRTDHDGMADALCLAAYGEAYLG